jgi:PAS domain S-box-containing protein
MAENGDFPRRGFDDRFELLVNAVTDYAIYMLDREGRITTWNPGARRFKGYEAEDVIGEHYRCFFTPEDREAGLPERQLEIAEREGRFEAEGWRVRKDGSRFWAHVVLDPVRRPDGELIGFAKITRDVTAKREAERALWESEQRFRMLVQNVRDYAIYMLDREGRITNWNPGAEAIKGYTENEIVGEHFSLLHRGRLRQWRAGAGTGDRAQGREIREGGLARPQERRALLGQRAARPGL